MKTWKLLLTVLLCSGLALGYGLFGCGDDDDNGGTGQKEGCTVDADCDDGLFCNGAEICDAVQGCLAGEDPCPDPLGCDEDSDQCTGCDEDADCDDGLFCNGVETCTDNQCQAGTPVDCDDGVDCTVDSCNEDTDACENTPDDGACDDGLFCNGVEICDAVQGCLAGEDPCPDPLGCDEDNDQCTGCTDADNDGYGLPGSDECTFPEEDCDDSNPDVHPGGTEGPSGDPTCSDILDNDCDGYIDLADPDCQ